MIADVVKIEVSWADSLWELVGVLLVQLFRELLVRVNL